MLFKRKGEIKISVIVDKKKRNTFQTWNQGEKWLNFAPMKEAKTRYLESHNTNFDWCWNCVFLSNRYTVLSLCIVLLKVSKVVYKYTFRDFMIRLMFKSHMLYEAWSFSSLGIYQ